MNQQQDYLRKSKDIFTLINNYRKTPKSLAKQLENLRRHLDKPSKILSDPGKIQIQMVEGDAVFIEAINFLNSCPSLAPLQWDENLTLSAMDHVLDIGPKGLLSYQGSDGTEPEERISKYGEYVDSLGENIDFGPNDAIGVIVSLTLDDGESDRPHRDNLFKSDYQKVGIACGPHKTEYQMCVMDFAYDFYPINKELEEGLNAFQVKPAENIVKNSQRNNEKQLIEDPLPTGSFSQNMKREVESNYCETFGKNEKTLQGNVNNTLNQNKDTAKGSNPLGNIKSMPNTNQNLSGNSKAAISTISPHVIDSSNIHSPLVRLSLDEENSSTLLKNTIPHQQYKEQGQLGRNEIDDMESQVTRMNSGKKVVSKFVEVQTKIIYTFNDGSTKEEIEKQNHTFNFE